MAEASEENEKKAAQQEAGQNRDHFQIKDYKYNFVVVLRQLTSDFNVWSVPNLIRSLLPLCTTHSGNPRSCIAKCWPRFGQSHLKRQAKKKQFCGFSVKC